MGSLGPTGRLDALASTSERSELLEVLQVLADRDRITRDLHEHVIGRLFGIGLTPAAGVLVLATTGTWTWPVTAALSESRVCRPGTSRVTGKW